MKSYLPGLIAVAITGLFIYFNFNDPPSLDYILPSRVTQQPTTPEYSLQVGAEPLGQGIYESESRSTVKVSNGTDTDVLIKMVNTENSQNTLVRNFYIPKNNVFMAEQLPEGSYKVAYAHGSDWNLNEKCFNRKRSFSIADSILVIRKTKTEIDGPNGRQVQTNYGGYNIDLKGSTNGNFSSHPINENKFNDI